MLLAKQLIEAGPQGRKPTEVGYIPDPQAAGAAPPVSFPGLGSSENIGHKDRPRQFPSGAEFRAWRRVLRTFRC
jgi:hypothetical protein